MEKQQISRIMIAGTGSGSGKTTITCGLCKCFQEMNLKVRAFKCGPDYIDSMFHSKVLGIQTGNLDSWFCDSDTLKELLIQNGKDSDISVIEGVMGYYDGAGFTEKGSSYEIAAMTNTPVILVVNCRGVSTSIGALLKGFLEFRENSQIRGVIFNQLSEKLYQQAADIAKTMGIMPLGYLPYQKESSLPSRHLGLVTADEIVHFKEKIDKIAEQMKKTVDLEGMKKIALGAKALQQTVSIPCNERQEKAPLRIAVAKDAAFCFLYQDNIDYLERNGCEIVYFSPLMDTAIPTGVHGVILSGGYPELYAKELSKNQSMRKSIAGAIQGGLPCIAECGGFLYLQKELESAEGEVFPMAGVIDGKGFQTKRLQRFGYMTLCTEQETMLAGKGEKILAHEFHYWNSSSLGTDYQVTKASDGSVADSGYGTESLYAGFPHIYFYGNRKAADRFIKTCRAYQGREKMIENLFPEVKGLQGINQQAVQQAKKHWNSIAKPIHGLGKMEDLVARIAGIQETPNIQIDKRAVIVMCGDNGIVEEGVTQTDQSVTALVSCNMAAGIASVCKMSAYAKADVIPVNIGIAAERLSTGESVLEYPGLLQKKVMAGTHNFLKEPAMSEEQMIQAVYVGICQVADCKAKGYKMLATGEMGIGNTTTSTALASILLNLPAEQITGRGAGLDDDGLKRKQNVVRQAYEMYGQFKNQPHELLRHIGGLDIAGLTGVFLGGAIYRIPVVVDGVISAVAALLAVRMVPVVKDFILVSHQGKEPAMEGLLKELGQEAVIFGDLALGEGTGAVMLFPLLDMAMQIYNANTTFDDLHMEAYEQFS